MTDTVIECDYGEQVRLPTKSGNRNLRCPKCQCGLRHKISDPATCRPGLMTASEDRIPNSDVELALDDDLDIEDRGPRAWRNHHRTMLAICGSVLALAFVLRVMPDQRVEFVFLRGSPLPESCLSRTLFNVNCPGCGLTRSFIHLAAGRVGDSLSANRVGWLLLIAVLIQIPYRLAALKCVEAHQPPPLKKWHAIFSGVLIVALVGNWLFQIAGF